MNESAPLILVVDDEPYFQEIFSKKLSAEGFRVEIASDGEEAVRKAHEMKPKLVLMDVKMPGIDGVEAMLKIKEHPGCEDMKVIFLTSAGEPRGSEAPYDHKADFKAAADLGAVGYLRKSDDLGGIVQRIKSLL